MRVREQRKRERMRELQRMADYVCSLILLSDYPEIDIEIEKSKVRERCEELYPDSMDLFGYHGGGSRLPLLPITDAEIEDIRNTFTNAGFL